MVHSDNTTDPLGDQPAITGDDIASIRRTQPALEANLIKACSREGGADAASSAVPSSPLSTALRAWSFPTRPPPAPAWISAELLSEACATWSRLYGRDVSPDEAITMLITLKSTAETLLRIDGETRR